VFSGPSGPNIEGFIVSPKFSPKFSPIFSENS
jgi:hypothetical protein